MTSNWTEKAACKSLPTELFFNPKTKGRAKAVCARCPVTEQCAEYGGLDEGIFGGMTATERRRARHAQGWY